MLKVNLPDRNLGGTVTFENAGSVPNLVVGPVFYDTNVDATFRGVRLKGANGYWVVNVVREENVESLCRLIHAAYFLGMHLGQLEEQSGKNRLGDWSGYARPIEGD